MIYDIKIHLLYLIHSNTDEIILLISLRVSHSELAKTTRVTHVSSFDISPIFAPVNHSGT